MQEEDINFRDTVDTIEANARKSPREREGIAVCLVLRLGTFFLVSFRIIQRNFPVVPICSVFAYLP